MDYRLKDEAWGWDLARWKKELRDGNMYEDEEDDDTTCCFISWEQQDCFQDNRSRVMYKATDEQMEGMRQIWGFILRRFYLVETTKVEWRKSKVGQ